MDHAVKLTINGETREFPMGITYKEIVKEYEKTSPVPVILVIAGGKICELHKKAERDGEVQLVTTKDSIGNKTYKRTACLVLLKAIYDLAGKEKVDKVVLHYSVGSGFYFTMEGEQKLDQAFLDQVKKRMTELVEQKSDCGSGRRKQRQERQERKEAQGSMQPPENIWHLWTVMIM